VFSYVVAKHFIERFSCIFNSYRIAMDVELQSYVFSILVFLKFYVSHMGLVTG
jgi:hypothetical protein